MYDQFWRIGGVSCKIERKLQRSATHRTSQQGRDFERAAWLHALPKRELIMRFHKPETLLRLSLQMQNSAEGVSLTDIESIYGVSRRTAERMRDAVLRLYPQTEEVVDTGRQKRWRIPHASITHRVGFSADELG